MMPKRRLPLVLLPAFLLAAGAPAQTSRSLAEVKPEAVGFSSERLERLHALLQQKVEDRELAGIVTVLARHGTIVEFRTYGKKDLAGGAPMDKDAIFRIWSMTKPITGVAMMTFYEQGKWSPGDPVSKFLPEFAHVKVLKGTTAAGGALIEDPSHPPTMGELMSHTAGFTYGAFGDTPVDRMYREAKVLGAKSAQEFVEKLAKIPLLYQPGTKWVYSVSVDLQGAIVEKLSGKSLGDYMREKIFQPLAMNDTGFHVDASKTARFATMYEAGPGGLVPAKGRDAGAYADEPGFASGGGGLFSTAHDYLRFAQMLANGGELDGVRILAPSSVAVMRSNRLPRSMMDSDQFGIGFFHVSPGFGFGFDFGVHTDPGYTGRVIGRGSYTWEGAAGTWFWIDPANDVVFVGMIHRLLNPNSPDMSTLTQQAVYQALVNPEK